MAFAHFQVIVPLPGVYHISDCMGVCMTLLVGTERALLVDTGYGLEDVSAMVRSLTDKPVTVILTHGHHDHMLGACWFDHAAMFEEDLPDWETYSSRETKANIVKQAEDKGLTVRADFMDTVFPQPLPLREERVDLGGLHAEIIRCPGHTPGSAVVYVPERELLLTGDDWNPCTWLFFARALDLRSYRSNMRQLFARLPFRYVLCSHQHRLYPREMPERFLAAMTDEKLATACPVPLSKDDRIRPVRCDLTEDQYIVFDWNKYE